MPLVYSANSSNVLIDGQPLEGLQSISYRVVTEKSDIRAIGSAQRVDVVFGLKTVEGTLVVCSGSQTLDVCLIGNKPFQIVARLAKADGISQVAEPATISFDQCFVVSGETHLDANSTAHTTYRFSATKVNLS